MSEVKDRRGAPSPLHLADGEMIDPKSRPILFSAPMVRAILDGRKTQTRRVVKGVPSWDHYGRDIMDWGLSGIHQDEDHLDGTDRWALDVQTDVDDYHRRIIRCPYGAPGDRLWVRENFAIVPATAYRMSEGVQQTVNPNDPYEAAIYAAGWDRSIPRWKPSIHMPRWASRILLEVAEVRVERLQDISEADAKAEGIAQIREPAKDGMRRFGVPGMVDNDGCERPTAVSAFRPLWIHINGAASWDANPWVWVVEFRRVAQEARAA